MGRVYADAALRRVLTATTRSHYNDNCSENAALVYAAKKLCTTCSLWQCHERALRYLLFPNWPI